MQSGFYLYFRTCVTPSPTRVSSCSWERERACGNWLGTSRAGCRTCQVATRSCLSVHTLWEGKTYKLPEQPQNRKPPAAPEPETTRSPGTGNHPQLLRGSENS